jgi:hypothetical protein
VTYASKDADWQSAARDAAVSLHERLEAARQEVMAARQGARISGGTGYAAQPAAR